MKVNFALLLIFLPLLSIAQGVNNLWMMGASSWAGRPYYGGVNMNFYNSTLDTSWENRKMNFDATNGIICNKNGDRLFYSNGVWIANSVNDTMMNGTGLNPSAFTTEWAQDSNGLPSPQGNLIIPLPNDSNKYYLFHGTIDDYPSGTYCALRLYYTIIDMSEDSGRGAVIEKNHVLLNDSLVVGRITACKHANGRDWWLIVHQFRTSLSNLYYKYLITPAGILGPDTQSIGAGRYQASAGQCVFSPDGKYFAYYESVTALDIFDFDRCTGNYSAKAHVDINDSSNGGGVAFSPNSQVLYVSSTKYVYQFDMSAADIPSSKTTVAIWDGFYSPQYPLATTFYLAQLAPDGKIYIICGNSTIDIHVINEPDILGASCNLCQHCIHLPAGNAFTIANHPNYFLGAQTGSVCDTITGMQNAEMQNAELKIYPNPLVSEDITFTYHVSSEPGVINIYDVQGREMAQYHLPQWSSIQHLKLPKLESGIYLARLRQGEVVSSVKFVKQ